MYSKNIFNALALGLLTLTKINGYIVNDYTGKCNEIYTYLEGLGKRENFNGCNMNEEGDVIELGLYSYCLEDEELATVLSYNTIESLQFTKLFIDWNIDDSDDTNLIFRFGCASLPTNYEVLNTLTNLKTLELPGVKNLDNSMVANIPKSIENLEIGKAKLTQEMVDSLSELTNLKSLILFQTEIGEELNFSKFENLKNLSFLEIYYDDSYFASAPSNVQGNILKYCQSLKKLIIHSGIFNNDSLNAIGYLTELEELDLDSVSFESDAEFSSLENLKNLTSFELFCAGYSLNTISPSFFYLTKLKKLSISSCTTIITTSPADSLTWANLKDLEYLSLSYSGPNVIDINDLGDLPNLKEAYLARNDYSDITESLGSLKNIEVLDLSNNLITSLPKSIGNLENLRVLRLSRNKLASLPDEIGNLKNLEQLEFSNNAITSLPETLGNLVHLKKLLGTENHIVDLPTNIGNLSELEEFNFAYNEIVELPASIGDLNITSLRLLKNQIEKIPDEIGNMKNLSSISLSYNKITNIPSSLGNLKNLELLYLNDNLIDDYLPESLNSLPKLRTISLERNINIKGKTLTNPNVRTCNYYPPSQGYTYSMCEPLNASCKDYFGSLQPCGPEDDVEPMIEPTDDVEPTIEPTNDVETDYINLF